MSATQYFILYDVIMSKALGKIITHENGQTTHYIEDNFTDPWKACETILIQHGFARHAAFWYHWVPALARNYRVIRRDARGHGFSSAPAAGSTYDYTIETICSEIIDTMNQLNIEKVHFLGESTSGMVGEILAVKYPHRLHSLTICSSPTHLPPKALSLFAFSHSDWPTACRSLGSRGWAESLTKVPGTVRNSDPRYLNWWIDQAALSSSEGLAGYAQFLSRLDARDYLPLIRIPMLILAPTNSAAISMEDQEKIRAEVPGCQLVKVNGAGHEIYTENAIECQDAFLAFLNDIH